MRKHLFVSAVCALCAWACSRHNDRQTTPPPGETHTTAETGPAPGPREMTGQPVEEKKAEAEATPDETQKVGGKTTPAGMTDANVIAALIASNEHEVKIGDLVAGRSKRADVKRYAKMLSKDHGAALKKIDGLRGKMAIEPMDDENVRMMKDQSSEKISKLEGMTGKDLDQAFLEMAVEDHQKTLDRIDGELIPATQNEDLKTLMTDMRPTVQHHLDEAKKLLAKSK